MLLLVLEEDWLLLHVSSLANLDDLVSDADAVEDAGHEEHEAEDLPQPDALLAPLGAAVGVGRVKTAGVRLERLTG